MDKILNYLQSIPDQDLIKSLCILIYSSCYGLIPNNNDISLAAAGLLAHYKMLSPFGVASLATLSWAAGESSVYLLGRLVGKKVFNLKLIKKKMPEDKQQKISNLLNKNPIQFFFIIRLTPVLRACSILTMGGLGLSPIHFFTKHIPILITYAFMIFFFFYLVGTWLQSMFTEYHLYVMGMIIIVWLSCMIMVGKKLWNGLK